MFARMDKHLKSGQPPLEGFTLALVAGIGDLVRLNTDCWAMKLADWGPSMWLADVLPLRRGSH